ncbi:hypothetical protein Y88_2388 [Novosphingobium nitrogenifigens DSM 19370]|uniref:Uncharacterized protein n=1 Tax=Novosphingobium nitrogenifigens DSM 19370 TaxID=983920 RepID=F1Z6G6_9SPHN|nr:hypothetical protein Y88_2388 [Novosphingobium nitrogenifigens DSM 19370]
MEKVASRTSGAALVSTAASGRFRRYASNSPESSFIRDCGTNKA